MTSGDQIAETAREFEGTPYGHRGRTPGKSLDCVGIIVCAAKAHGIIVREPMTYTVPQRLSQTMSMLESALRKVPFYEKQPGDAVALNYGRGLAHIVMLLGGQKCIEACAIPRVRKVLVRDFPDGRPILGTFRIPGVE